MASVVVLALGTVSLGDSIPPAGAQVADNQIVVHAQFGNGTPGPDAVLEVHVECANEGGGPVVTVVDQTATMAAPWDPITFEIPVLEAGGTSTFVGCEVTPTWNISGLPMVSCAVRDAGSPPPDPSPPSGCGGLRTRVDAFFPVTVRGAVYDVTAQLLLPTAPPSDVAAGAPAAIDAAPVLTG
jgi:hypothetical protein